jgi:DNA-binding transcriptional LysR family regulator
MNEMVTTVYDAVTLDQLRGLVAVADEGSFSAAARKLKRVQSAVSTAMANLEAQLGVPIWDRSTKVPTLTEAGQAVLAAGRRVLAEVDELGKLTARMSLGVETSVSLCLDAFFPLEALIGLARGFAREFPDVDLRVDHQVLSAVSARVLAGEASLGVVSAAGLLRGLAARALSAIRMVPVAAPQHPLAQIEGRIAPRCFERTVQIVLSERADAPVADQGVLSPRTWRVGDLHTKRELLRAGLGWGNLPEHLAHEDLRTKRLVSIRPEAWGVDEHVLSLSAVYRTDAVLGPAHGWVLEQLSLLCARELDAPVCLAEAPSPGAKAKRAPATRAKPTPRGLRKR